MGCCPQNVTPIPPTDPPTGDPCNPMTPECPYYDPCDPMTPQCPNYPGPPGDLPVGFDKDVDILIPIGSSNIAYDYEDGDRSNHIDAVVNNGGTNWYEFMVPLESNLVNGTQIYFSHSVVNHGVAGGGDFYGYVSFQQDGVECGLSGPGIEISTSATTEAGGSCVVQFNKKLYFKIRQTDDVTSGGYRFSWGIYTYTP